MQAHMYVPVWQIQPPPAGGELKLRQWAEKGGGDAAPAPRVPALDARASSCSPGSVILLYHQRTSENQRAGITKERTP